MTKRSELFQDAELTRLTRARPDAQEGGIAVGQRRMKIAHQKKLAKFKRGASVAYINNIEVKIGEVIAPPGLFNPLVIVELLDGSRKPIHNDNLDVWKPPAAPAGK